MPVYNRRVVIMQRAHNLGYLNAEFNFSLPLQFSLLLLNLILNQYFPIFLQRAMLLKRRNKRY